MVAVSLTEQILKLEFIALLEVYHGDPVIIRQQIFWKAWIVVLFDFLAAPQITTPYTQSGCRRVLYSMSLRGSARFERRSGLSR